MDANLILPAGPPTERAEAIQQSLKCFVNGVLGFIIPVLGLGPAVSALVGWRTVNGRFRGQWNPADHLLKAGGVLGILGILSNTVLIAVLAIAISQGLLD